MARPSDTGHGGGRGGGTGLDGGVVGVGVRVGVGVVRSWYWKGSKETTTRTLPMSVLTHPRSRLLTLTILTLILTDPAVWDGFKISVDVLIC